MSRDKLVHFLQASVVGALFFTTTLQLVGDGAQSIISLICATGIVIGARFLLVERQVKQQSRRLDEMTTWDYDTQTLS